MPIIVLYIVSLMPKIKTKTMTPVIFVGGANTALAAVLSTFSCTSRLPLYHISYYVLSCLCPVDASNPLLVITAEHV